MHWTIESVDGDLARGFARISTLVGEDVIDDDVVVVLTASESGSGTVTFGSQPPVSARWTADELIIDFSSGERVLTPTTPDGAVAARRVLVDAANAARDEAAATTTQAPTTTVPPVEPEPLIGVLTLESDGIEGEQDTCRGTGGYSDFGAGMNITVRDGDGSIIATSTTRNFSDTDYETEDMDDLTAVARAHVMKAFATYWFGDYCEVWFVADVPKAAFYEIEVGRRGSLSFSFDDLVRQEWKVELTLG